MAYTFTVALPEGMELIEDGRMLRIIFDKPYDLFELTDQFRSLESALLIGLGYGGEVTE